MNELSLFTGAGGGLLATQHLLGWKTIGYVEIDKYCQNVLLQRIEDGMLDMAPIFNDIRAFNKVYAETYQGMVDVITAGFPCQAFSVAGKQKGEQDERNLWPETRDAIGIVRPRYVYLENVPNLLTHTYIWRILSDITEMGYDCRWGIVSAADVGAPHHRKRLWIYSYSNDNRFKGENLPLQSRRQNKADNFVVRCSEITSNAKCHGLERQIFNRYHQETNKNKPGGTITGGVRPSCWKSNFPECGILGMDDGMANWMDRIAATGEGQVPRVVEIAWEILSK